MELGGEGFVLGEEGGVFVVDLLGFLLDFLDLLGRFGEGVLKKLVLGLRDLQQRRKR